jgi:hypothetical protein
MINALISMSKVCTNNPLTKRPAQLGRWPFILVGIGLLALGGCGSEAAWKSRSFAFTSPPDPVVTASHTNVLSLREVTISPLFQGRAFTYQSAEGTYEHDPYAGFFVPPERALEQPVRAWLRDSGLFGSVIEPDSALHPSLEAEVAINELYGDFHKSGHPAGVMEIHFILYQMSEDGPGRVLLDKTCSRQTSMPKAAPAALMAAWDADLREIMAEVNSALKQLDLH